MSRVQLITMPEVALALKVSKYRAYEMARDGRIPVVRIGRLVRMKESVLERLVDLWEDAGGLHPDKTQQGSRRLPGRVRPSKVAAVSTHKRG
jgi:excisionase family DNA binding protein